MRTLTRWRLRGSIMALALGAIAVLVLPAWGAIYSDIQGNFAQQAVERLAAKGIFRVPADGKFNPTATVTRLDMAIFLSRALGLSGQGLSLPDLKDGNDVPRDAQSAVAAVMNVGTVAPPKIELKKGQITYTLSTDKALYGPGDLVRLKFEVKNTGTTDVQFDFANSQFHDFVVREADGTEIARWSVGRAFLPIQGPVTLAAGATYPAETLWRQLDQNDNPVPPGRYEIIAIHTTKSNPTTLTLTFTKGLMPAFSDDTWRPKAEVARADLAAFVVRAMGLGEGPANAAIPVADAATIPAALRGAVATAVDKKILIVNAANQIRPAAPATRADVAWALDQLMTATDRYDFSKGVLKDVTTGTPAFIVVEDVSKAQRTFRVARANAIYRSNAPATLRDLKPGDKLLFLKPSDVGDVAYIEASP
ncbi:MAG TPA: BsuPI-related putative proteinase inhibitor [bacterium]|jgi:hypothetical protein